MLANEDSLIRTDFGLGKEIHYLRILKLSAEELKLFKTNKISYLDMFGWTY